MRTPADADRRPNWPIRLKATNIQIRVEGEPWQTLPDGELLIGESQDLQLMLDGHAHEPQARRGDPAPPEGKELLDQPFREETVGDPYDAFKEWLKDGTPSFGGVNHSKLPEIPGRFVDGFVQPDYDNDDIGLGLDGITRVVEHRYGCTMRFVCDKDEAVLFAKLLEEFQRRATR